LNDRDFLALSLSLARSLYFVWQHVPLAKKKFKDLQNFSPEESDVFFAEPVCSSLNKIIFTNGLNNFPTFTRGGNFCCPESIERVAANFPQSSGSENFCLCLFFSDQVG